MEMQDANLNRDDSELTPQELVAKQEALEIKKELEDNRRDAMKKFLEFKDLNKDSKVEVESIQSSLKRPANDSLQSPYIKQ
jgi:hypothetical protein